MSPDHVADSGFTASPAISDEAVLASRVRSAAWCFLVLAGLIEAAFSRHAMQDDGISYLDMGDAIVRGDWKMALNGVWSPLYPWLQGLALQMGKPSSYSQFTVVHGVNFLIYLLALAWFDFLLRVAVADRPRADARGTGPLPKWAVFAVGYSVFLWSSVSLINIGKVAPDMLMAAVLYLAVALLMQIWARPQSLSRFVLLGAALGIGYLAKAPVFPLAFIFFAIAWFLAGGWRQATLRVFAAVVIFLAISGPWFIALSHAKGRLTFGDSARFNYVFHVNGAGPGSYFQGLGTATGHFAHPVHKIFDAPPIYEFSTPLKGTSPIEYDPSYWSEGVVPQVSLKRELSVIRHSLSFYFDLIQSSQTVLLAGFIVLCFIADSGLFLKQVMARWPVWLIGLVGLGMYAPVHVELRYIGVLFTLFWVGLFSGLEMPPGREGRRLAALVTLVVVVALATPPALSVAGHLKGALSGQAHNQWQVAEDLQTLGVRPGDRVARFPAHFGLAWARLLGVRVVAEVPLEKSADFWCAKPEIQAKAIETLRRVGVKVVVAEQITPIEACLPGREWRKVGDGTYYALALGPSAVK